MSGFYNFDHFELSCAIGETVDLQYQEDFKFMLYCNPGDIITVKEHQYKIVFIAIILYKYIDEKCDLRVPKEARLERIK